MAEELSEESRNAINDFLFKWSETDRRQALKNLLALPERAQVVDFLSGGLVEENDHWRRTWYITGLAELDNAEADALQVVTDRLDPQVEEFEWCRYWAAVGVTRMLARRGRLDELRALLRARVENDPSPFVKAVALRLLLEKEAREEYLDGLTAMLESPHWNDRQAACKALRLEAAPLSIVPPDETAGPVEPRPTFPIWVENKLLTPLAKILHNRGELGDVRYQAAQASKSLRRNPAALIDILAKALTANMPDLARRTCLEALRRLKDPVSKDALLLALEDSDAEIRQRAADGLKEVLEPATALGFIIKHLLQQPDEAAGRARRYIEALRQIDDREAAKLLLEYLFHPDPAVANRASQALTALGGEAAVRTLQAQRTQAVAQYTQLLGDADQKIMLQFESLMARARLAFTVSMVMHGTIFGLGVITLLASIYIATGSGQDALERAILGVGGAGGSLAVLLVLFYRNPFRNITQSVINLVKVNVVFLGYIRQINQIDATFKQLFLAAGGFSATQMKETVAEIELTVHKTLDKVRLYLEDIAAAPSPTSPAAPTLPAPVPPELAPLPAVPQNGGKVVG